MRMQISIKDGKNKFSDLVHRAEAGETIVVTRHGKAVAEIVPYTEKKRGINWEALAAYKKKHGIENIVTFISPDFDDPLPEDFLITPTIDQE
jgi:prevent-host-death family protein